MNVSEMVATFSFAKLDSNMSDSTYDQQSTSIDASDKVIFHSCGKSCAHGEVSISELDRFILCSLHRPLV